MIDNYMENWLRKGGRCAIFTRDMTWANKEILLDLLKEKSQANEVTLFMASENDISCQLKACGATVYYY